MPRSRPQPDRKPPLVARCLLPALLLVSTASASPPAELLERGWFTAAREAASTPAERRRIDQVVETVATMLAQQSDQIESVARWGVRWSRPLSAASLGPVVGHGFVAWCDPRGLNLVRLIDGKPPWGERGHRETLLLPDHTDPALAGVDVGCGPPALAAGRLFAVLHLPDAAGEAQASVVAIDLAATAEGRLLWMRSLGVLNDGPLPKEFAVSLAADDSCCLVAGMDPGEGSFLAAYDAGDGRPLWRQALPGRSPGSISLPVATFPDSREQDLGRPEAHAAIVQHLAVTATPAGDLRGFAIDTGEPAWTRSDTLPEGWLVTRLEAAADAVALTAQMSGKPQQNSAIRLELSLTDGRETSRRTLRWPLPGQLPGGIVESETLVLVAVSCGADAEPWVVAKTSDRVVALDGADQAGTHRSPVSSPR
jgi:hypothetical protein